MTFDEWVANNKPNHPTGFECVGRERMNQVLNAALASREADRDNLAAALQDEITYAAEKELREFFRLVDITNTEPHK